MSGNNIIEIRNLKKSFSEVKAVDDISFDVRRGELFAFLGVNGAGKSTTISVMCSTLTKDEGEVIIDGYSIDTDAERIREEIGVVFQSSVLDKPLTVLDNLKSRAALYGIVDKAFDERLKSLCVMFDLEPILKRPVGKLSGGQRRRVDIARAMINDPKILILDEPTTGLDPKTRSDVWSVINELRARGMTVFLTTHYMEEAADADYVVIIDSGKIVAHGTPLELKNTYTGDSISLYGVSEADIKALGAEYEPIPDGYRIRVGSTKEATALIMSSPGLFSDYEVIKGKMDDVFLAVTGKRLSGGDEK